MTTISEQHKHWPRRATTSTHHSPAAQLCWWSCSPLSRSKWTPFPPHQMELRQQYLQYNQPHSLSFIMLRDFMMGHSNELTITAIIVQVSHAGYRMTETSILYLSNYGCISQQYLSLKRTRKDSPYWSCDNHVQIDTGHVMHAWDHPPHCWARWPHVQSQAHLVCYI